MEEQDILNLEVGEKEIQKKKLKPAKVKIVKVSVENIVKAKTFKAKFCCKHPDSENTIDISAVSFLEGRNIKTVGTWVNTDEDGKLQKGTGLTLLMERLGAKTLLSCQDKEIETEQDENNFLVFKAY